MNKITQNKCYLSCKCHPDIWPKSFKAAIHTCTSCVNSDIFLMFSKGFSKSASLVSYVRGIHMIKDGQNCQFGLFHTFKFFCQFSWAPPWRSIVCWENNYSILGFFYCFQEFWGNILSSLKFLIILKSDNTFLFQGSIKMICEILAGVNTAKIDEHMVFPSRARRRRRRRRWWWWWSWRGGGGSCLSGHGSNW